MWDNSLKGSQIETKRSLYSTYSDLPPAVLPSRSTFSDLGLVSDLCENMLLNLSKKSFSLKQPPVKSKKTYILNRHFFQIKFAAHFVKKKIWNKSDFDPKNMEFGSAFDLLFSRNIVRYKSDFEIPWCSFLLASTGKDGGGRWALGSVLK